MVESQQAFGHRGTMPFPAVLFDHGCSLARRLIAAIEAEREKMRGTWTQIEEDGGRARGGVLTSYLTIFENPVSEISGPGAASNWRRSCKIEAGHRGTAENNHGIPPPHRKSRGTL